MSTRSTIALEFADGTVQQVYCNADGYLEYNGRILFESYSDPFKLRDLIDRGGMSQLGREVDQCEFYGDDPASCYRNFGAYFIGGFFEEYNYILRNNGVWEVRTGRQTGPMMLKDALSLAEAV